MTKDEFLSMISSELEILKKEYQSAKQRAEYFRLIDHQAKEYREAFYQFKVVSEKIHMIEDLVSLPAYARIQAMSDAEVEEYKKDKTEELKLKIKEIESKEQQAKEKLSLLKSEQEELIAQFGSLTGSKRDENILRGKQLAKELYEYDADNQFGIFAKLKKELEEVKKQQEKIETMTQQEVRQQLSSEIKFVDKIAKEVELTKKSIDASKIKSLDPQKALSMTDLTKSYYKLVDKQTHVKNVVTIDQTRLPYALIEKIGMSSHYDRYLGTQVIDPEVLMEKVQKFEDDFEKVCAQFTKEKLFKLVDKRGIDSIEVDIDFLQQHADKLRTESELSSLQDSIKERNKLSKKTFKTKDVKHRIENLNYMIREAQRKAYEEIILWYIYRSREFLKVSISFDAFSSNQFKYTFEKFEESFGEIRHIISELKEKIQKVKSETKKQIEQYEEEKNDIIKQIRELGGERYEKIVTPSDNIDSLELIAFDKAIAYENDVVDKVQQEAQKQADIKEAELRGITVEQLLQMRQQAQSVTDEPAIETGEEEVSHGMKK